MVEIRNIANSAKILLTNDEVEAIGSDVEKIDMFVADLRKVDDEKAKPLINSAFDDLSLDSLKRGRNDFIANNIESSAILSNAPSILHGYISVSK